MRFLVMAAFLTLLGCGSSENPDCAEARQLYGPGGSRSGSPGYNQGCSVISGYGTCPLSFDDCTEGTCQFSAAANANVCVQSCTTTAQCGSLYCKDNICQPGCAAHTYCDGTTCCSYAPNPSDPTVCKQTSCVVQ